MSMYVVSYDLIKRKDYPELWKELASFPVKQHLLGSTWIVKSELSATDLATRLIRHIDGDDKFIVSEIVVPHGSAWTTSFPDEALAWLSRYLD